MGGPLNWTALIYLIGVLLLLSPWIAYVFKAHNALRNATIWLALLAGLGWIYHFYGDKNLSRYINTPDYYYQGASPKPDAEETKLPADEAEEDNNPVRNP